MRYRLLVLLLFRFSFSDMKNAGPVSGTGIDYFVSLLENFVHRLLEVISYRSGCFVAGTVVPARAVVTTEVTALATVFATVSTFTALATRATVVAVIALAAISARLALRLNISFRLLYECPHRETHLTGLGIDLKEFDIHFVAHLEHVLDLISLGPGNLGYVEQTFLSRENLHEGAELKDGNDLSVIYGTHFRNGADALDPVNRLLHVFLIVGSDVHNSLG